MAVRACFSIPAGGHYIHTLEWPSHASVEDAGRPAGAPNSLQWSAVVLGELTVNLEVSVRVHPQGAKPGDGELLKLDRQACGGTFVGRLRPERDRRLLPKASDTATPSKSAPEGTRSAQHAAVAAVVFSFSNAFSWLTAKNLELITVFDWPQPTSIVRELPILPPVSSRPAHKSASNLDALPRFATVPKLRACGGETSKEKCGTDELERFVTQLAEWADSAAAGAPHNHDAHPWLQNLLGRLSDLQTFCHDGPPAQEQIEHQCPPGNIASTSGLEWEEQAWQLEPECEETEEVDFYGEAAVESAGEDAESTGEGASAESALDAETAQAASSEVNGYEYTVGDDVDEEMARKARARQKAQRFGAAYTMGC